jgi:ABC-type nitrate/sulfonate/bicarbonate transport system ATPase subunit
MARFRSAARASPIACKDEEFFYRFRRRVGLVFQNADAQLFTPSVFHDLAFGPLQLRWPAPKIRERVEAVLRAMDIAHLRDRAPHRLSGAGGARTRACRVHNLVNTCWHRRPACRLETMVAVQVNAALRLPTEFSSRGPQSP